MPLSMVLGIFLLCYGVVGRLQIAAAAAPHPAWHAFEAECCTVPNHRDLLRPATLRSDDLLVREQTFRARVSWFAISGDGALDC